jgi:hypothetical protein
MDARLEMVRRFYRPASEAVARRACGWHNAGVRLGFIRASKAEGSVMSSEEELREHAKKMGVFIKNRQAFPQGELDKYEGQYVAWAPDGTHIVAASSESYDAVCDGVVAAGYDPQEVVFSYVPRGDENFI